MILGISVTAVKNILTVSGSKTACTSFAAIEATTVAYFGIWATWTVNVTDYRHHSSHQGQVVVCFKLLLSHPLAERTSPTILRIRLVCVSLLILTIVSLYWYI